jgi:hypothetical protein
LTADEFRIPSMARIAITEITSTRTAAKDVLLSARVIIVDSDADKH